MADLFQMIEDRREDHNVDVVVTFLEIYNEEIRDLEAAVARKRNEIASSANPLIRVRCLLILTNQNCPDDNHFIE